jgi:hypothetical protein
MSLWTLLILILVAWLPYPFVGAVGVAANVAEGKSPPGAGFSFLPELLVFPPLFLGVAALVDAFVMPWGRLIVGALCVVLVALHASTIVRYMIRLRRARRNAA